MSRSKNKLYNGLFIQYTLCKTNYKPIYRYIHNQNPILDKQNNIFISQEIRNSLFKFVLSRSKSIIFWSRFVGWSRSVDFWMGAKIFSVLLKQSGSHSHDMLTSRRCRHSCCAVTSGDGIHRSNIEVALIIFNLFYSNQGISGRCL